MKKSAKIIVFVLLSIILFGVNAQKIQADVVDKASEYLLKQTGDSSFWNKIHALEFLCQVGYKPQVQTILKKDFEYVSSIPEKESDISGVGPMQRWMRRKRHLMSIKYWRYTSIRIVRIRYMQRKVWQSYEFL